MYTLFLVSLVTSYLLLTWFKKDTIVEYRWLFPKLIRSWWRLDEYVEVSADDTKSSYPKFLLEYGSKGFFHRMVNCEVCLSVWLTGLLNLAAYGWLAWYKHNWWLLVLVIPTSFAAASVSLLIYYALLRMMTNGNT